VIKRDIVVIGASAGGMEALKQLVKDLPATLKASIFIVLHTVAKSSTLLEEILQRHTVLPILTPANGQIIHHGHIYIAPPHYHMQIKNGKIHLSQGPLINHFRPAIDPLFRSAALHHGARTIGVILTGMLDDGTVGLSFIKNQGGISIVQHPEDAQYPDMPRSALAHVSIDYCVPLSEIAPLITKLTKTSVKTKSKPVPDWMPTEAKLSTTNITPVEELNHLGKISPFTCPECHGNLWEIDKDKVLRYRCRIGHAFGPQTLSAVHEETMENILWSAVRTLEESAELSHRIATHTHKNHVRTASLFYDKAKVARQKAKKLKALLLIDEDEKA
jgi:two-component system chemotaxis response regulator CheB